MRSSEIKKRFLNFFTARGHVILPPVSLLPNDDPSVLFTTAGMQQLTPYLMGEPHPAGRRLVNVQKCLRTVDIDEVGDKTHNTFFQMLGNWSLGDYFKKEAIAWSYRFLTSKTEGLGLDPDRLYVTVFSGGAQVPADTESAGIWQDLGIPNERIYYLSDNWWTPGPDGPAGPDTEMFYDLTDEGLDLKSVEEFKKADAKQQVVEVWNNVFMEYEQKGGVIKDKLIQQNVDTGAGFERLVAVMQGKTNVFDTDLFLPLRSKLGQFVSVRDDRSERIIVDHIRASVFLVADGVRPSNTEQGYILRRLLRRAIRFGYGLGIGSEAWSELIETVIKQYGEDYPELPEGRNEILRVILEEEGKFQETLAKGLKEFEKQVSGSIDGPTAFKLFSTYGFPWEMIKELAHERGVEVAPDEDFRAALAEHQKKSRTGSEKRFAGGLASQEEQAVKYHTATHLLHQALIDVLGEHVTQKGSHITGERLRFDFSHSEKLTATEKEALEKKVNEKISADLPVRKVTLSRQEAEETGAKRFFQEKYGDEVTVYYIGDSLADAYSKEFCGGPHVDRTGVLGKFKIAKEESVAAGTRRIKARLE